MEVVMKRSFNDSTEKVEHSCSLLPGIGVSSPSMTAGLSTVSFRRSRFKLASSETYGTRSPIAIGEGTYSSVFKIVKASEKGLKTYAFKLFKPEGRGIEVSIYAMREIAVLQALRHPSIISIIDVCDLSPLSHSDMGMLLEMGNMTLEEEIKQVSKGTYLIDRNIRNRKYMAQLSSAVHYLHFNGMSHRDLKPANILCFDQYVVKLCDFGSSRLRFFTGGDSTGGVQTIFWRAPELALGAKTYGREVDVYSLGIIFAQLFLDYCPIYVRDGEGRDLAGNLFKLLDGMTLEEWPEMESLPDFKKAYPDLGAKFRKGWKTIFEKGRRAVVDSGSVIEPIPSSVVELVSSMTYGNPVRRMTIKEVSGRLKEWSPVLSDEMRVLQGSEDKLTDNSDQYRCPGSEKVLLGKAYDLLLCMCLKGNCTGNFSYARELLRRYVAVISNRPLNIENLMPFSSHTLEYLCSASLVTTSKLHDVIYVDANGAFNQLVECFEDGFGDLKVELTELFVGRPIDLTIRDIRIAERSLLLVLDFDLVFPSQTDLIENYIRNEADFLEIPFGGECLHDFHGPLKSYADFILVVQGLIYITGVLADDQFSLIDTVRLSLYLALRVFNRRVKGVFSLQDLEIIKRQWPNYSSIMLQPSYPVGCKIVHSKWKVGIALDAAKQLRLKG